MNIFVLDLDPIKAAEYQCNKHVVKMVTETAQLLSNAYHINGEYIMAPYKPSHLSTRMGRWSSESMDNWYWLLTHGLALYQEYRYRYDNNIHLAGEAILQMSYYPPNLERIGITQRPLNMPDKYKSNDVVQSYRRYYREGKADILFYTLRERPIWL